MTHRFIFPLLVLVAVGVSPATAQDGPDEPSDPDLLSFLNGDFLHGEFGGMTDRETVVWKHSDVPDPISLETRKMRRIALNGGQARTRLDSHSFVRLANGDRIPGKIQSMDDKTVHLVTPFAGELALPRNSLTVMAPRPHGGKVHYLGPYSRERWTILAPAEEPSPEPEVPADEEAPLDEEEAPDKTLQEDPWVLSGGAWYSNGVIPLALDAQLPDQSLISFNLAWRNRLNAIVAFHATLEVPEKEAEEAEENEEEPVARRRPFRPGHAGGTKGFPLLYGESYVLTLYSSYAQLYRCTFNEEGEPEIDRLSASSSNIRLNETGEAVFELRCDREEAKITLYADGQFVTQWTDPDGYAGTGSQLAFACQNADCRLRISDLVVTSWNGMIDSALSMESKDRDVILLTNGTDRFSGSVVGISDGALALKGTFADMTVPLTDIQEIRFAGKDVEESPAHSDYAVRVLLQPVGRVTVEPQDATKDTLNGLLGSGDRLSIDLDHVDIIEFTFGESALDSWDEDF